MNSLDTSVDDGSKTVSDDWNVGEYIALLLEFKKLIVITTVLALALGVIYILVIPPKYQVDTVIQVDTQSPGGDGLLGDLGSLLDIKPVAATEIEILQSRMVLGDAVNSLHLDIAAAPVYMPIIGSAFSHFSDNFGLTQEPQRFGSYVLRGAAITVTSFDVPRRYLEKDWTLEYVTSEKIQITDPDGNIVYSGPFSKPFVFSTAAGAVSAAIDQIKAVPGMRFKITKSDPLKVMTALQTALDISEQGKQTGIIGTTYTTTDPQLGKRILDHIADYFVAQNVRKKSEDAANMIGFLDKQIPTVKASLTAAESRYTEYRTKNGVVDLPEEARSFLSTLVQLEVQKNQLQQQKDELSQRFTPQHPMIAGINRQMASADEQIARLNGKLKTLPANEQSVLGLARDASVAQGLYVSLLNNREQLQVLQAGKAGNIRVIDHAEIPLDPVAPKKVIVIIFSLATGLFVGVAGAFVLTALRAGVEDPNVIERETGLSVLALIPHSDNQDALSPGLGAGGGSLKILAEEFPQDLAIESLRSLRTSLHFSSAGARNNIIMISGPAPTVGKSFTTVNFCTVLASAGQKVLMIDGDLRKGYLQKFFGLPRTRGLADVLRGKCTVEEAVVTTRIAGLDFIPNGELLPQSSELLMAAELRDSLEALSAKYDYVVIDSAPVLAVADAAILGKLAGTNLLLLKFGQQSLREIELANKRLRLGGVKLDGVIMNNMPMSSSKFGFGKYKYAYAYSYEASEKH